MGRPKVNIIYVDSQGEPSNTSQSGKKAETVVWVPDDDVVTVTIRFDLASPFRFQTLQAPGEGGCIGGVVVGADGTYPYHLSVANLTGQRFETEPEIIVDTGGSVPNGLKGRRKAAQKKSSKKKAYGGKARRKKAARRR